MKKRYKIPLFFLVAFGTLLYLDIFWKHRHLKIHLRFFGRGIDTNLGLLGLMVFFDGAILAFFLLWLLGFLEFWNKKIVQKLYSKSIPQYIESILNNLIVQNYQISIRSIYVLMNKLFIQRIYWINIWFTNKKMVPAKNESKMTQPDQKAPTQLAP